MNELEMNISTSDDLVRFLRSKGENHRWYKFYTSNGAFINSVVNEKALFLSDGAKWNDLQDRGNFNHDDSKEKRFGLCMSFAKSENVAMWLLYGKDDGYMIDFGNQVINSCLKQDFVECGNIRDKHFERKITVPKSNFKIEVLDIIYYGQPKDGDTDSFYIKRADDSVQNCPCDIIQGIDYCKKTTPWQYECECRLIVTISKKIEGIDGCDTIKVPFEDSYVDELKKRIYHSPNHKEDEVYARSTLFGKMEWKLSM